MLPARVLQILSVLHVGRRIMRLVPEVRVPFDHVASRVANTGASFALGVAYLLFVLMFLTMIAEILLVTVRPYF